MAHKRIGGWLIPVRLYAVAKFADELWYYSRKDGRGERQVSLFFAGWYETPGKTGKLFTLHVLWVSIQLGVASC